MAKTDLYAVLGVDRSASADEIKQAYRKLALEHHPDVNPGNDESEERFKEISAAKEVLLSPEKRKLYDEFGMDGLASGFDASQARAYQEWSSRAQKSPDYGAFDSHPGGADQGIEDLLHQLFGEGAGAQRRQGFHFGGGQEAPHSNDAEAELAVDFIDAINGNQVEMRIEGRDPIHVTIPRGAHDGTRIRLKGQGVAGQAGRPAGDLYLRLSVRPHPWFRREGDDLHADLPVTIPELVLGADVEIPTPDGTTTVKIPPRSNPGQTLRLPNRGAERPGKKGAGKKNRGHLFLHLTAVLPPDGGEELEEAARNLAKTYGDKDPRASLRWEAR